MLEKLCFECFGEKNEEGVCTTCWKKENAENGILQIQRGVVLEERYIIGRVLGQGGFGITYLAFDKSKNICVALKEFFPSQIATRTGASTKVVAQSVDKEDVYKKYLDSFIKEVRLLSKFKHKNIVEVINLVESNGTAYMVMPYLEGTTLKSYLAAQREQKLDVADMLNFIMPVLDGLVEVHKNGIVHRDISPDNIYITNRGEVKILDFGAARQTFGAESLSFSVILKEGFAPKEQYSRKGKQGPWTDVYAVAATICAAVTGKKLPGALDRDAGDQLLLPSYYGIDINESLERVLEKALEMDPSRRYQSIEEFRQAVSLACREGSEEAVSSAAKYNNAQDKTVLEEVSLLKNTWQNTLAGEKQKSTKDSKRHLKVIAAIAIVVFVIVGGYYYFRSSDSSSSVLKSKINLVTYTDAESKIKAGEKSFDILMNDLAVKKNKLNDLKASAQPLSAAQLTNEMSAIKSGLPDISTEQMQKNYVDDRMKTFFGGLDTSEYRKKLNNEADGLKKQEQTDTKEIDLAVKESLIKFDEEDKVIKTDADKLRNILTEISKIDAELTNILMAKMYPPAVAEVNTSSSAGVSSGYSTQTQQSAPARTQTTQPTYQPPPPSQDPPKPAQNNTTYEPAPTNTKVNDRPPMRD